MVHNAHPVDGFDVFRISKWTAMNTGYTYDRQMLWASTLYMVIQVIYIYIYIYIKRPGDTGI